jgi:very-short-patch-repair endonuclease
MRPKSSTGSAAEREWGVGNVGSIANLARRQHGLVTRTQLLARGMDAAAVKRRLRAGRLRAIYRGVYLVGPIVPPHARELAAVLACGEGAVLSHRSAAALWQLLPYPATSAPIDVTVIAVDRRRPGIRVHRVISLEPDEVTTHKGIPVTTPARTMLDLAADEAERDLEQALAAVERSHKTSRAKLLSLLTRYPGRRGAPTLRALLDADSRPALTRSEAEERFLALVTKAKLPPPEVNVRLADFEVDFLWREQRLVVEVDGYAHHADRASFEADRARDAVLAARGFRVVRVTWRQIVAQPEAVIARLAQGLAWAPG